MKSILKVIYFYDICIFWCHEIYDFKCGFNVEHNLRKTIIGFLKRQIFEHFIF